MQRRKLHGNPGGLVNARLVARASDCVDGMLVCFHVNGGVLFGESGLAEHIEGIEESALLERLCVLERLLDRLAGHELTAEKPHREIHGLSYDRLATPSQDAAQGSCHAMLAARRDELAGYQQAPGRRVHEPGPARADMRSPVALGSLSRMRTSRVSSSGMRKSDFARHISAMPSGVESANSFISASTPKA